MGGVVSNVKESPHIHKGERGDAKDNPGYAACGLKKGYETGACNWAWAPSLFSYMAVDDDDPATGPRREG